jgi:hypothetical protein
MLNDVTPPHHRLHAKPKRIEPLEHPPKTSIHELAAQEDAAFKTPEEIATLDNPEPKPIIAHHTAPKKQKKWQRWLPRTRKQQYIIGAVAVLLIAGAVTGWAATHHKHTALATKTVVKKSAPKPKAPVIIYSTLTGLPVADSSVNQRPVTGVMIENSLDARPQSGLGDAGVVFEAVAEGGVTRFLALYQDTMPTNVGPIRSARPYYVQWAMGFDAAYAHVGGSPDALNDITAWGVHDMNQFYNGAYYHRVSNRAAPHNVYTGIDTLNQLEAKKGYTSTYTGFTRGKEAAAATPTATSIDFHLSGVYYDPHYAYNATTNSYDRSEYNTPHVDANSGKQLSPKVAIAIVVPLARGDLDSSGAYYSNYNVIGSGAAYIFQNGTIVNGTWNKPGNSSPLTFTDASGQPIPLNPGQTWITAVSATNQVSYK